MNSRDRDRPRESNQEITVEQYVSTLPYETMPLKQNFFSTIANNEYIKKIFPDTTDPTFTSDYIANVLNNYRGEFINLKNKQIDYNGTYPNDILKKEMFNYLLQYRFFELYNSPEDIVASKNALFTGTGQDRKKMTKDEITAKKGELNKQINNTTTSGQLATLKQQLYQLESNEKVSENKTLYILPTIQNASNDSITSNLNKDLREPYKKFYSNIFKSTPDNIFFLPIFSLNGEDLDTFKSRIDQELVNLTNKIKAKGKDDNTAYNKIIYFVNNNTDKYLYTGFFKLTLKKDFISELNNKLKNFFVTRIERQSLRLNNNIFFNDIKNLKADVIIRNLNATKKYKDDSSKELNDSIFKNALESLVESLKNCYLSYTNDDFRKSLSENQNINKFDIYIRLENLDDAVPMNTIVASNEYFYLFLEAKKLPKIGYFEVSNVSKNQYFFVVDKSKGIFKKWKSAVCTPGIISKINAFIDDKTKNPKYKATENTDKDGIAIKLKNDKDYANYKYGDMIKFNKDEDWTWSDEYTKYAMGKPNDEEEDDEEETTEGEVITDKNVKRILIEIRYNYGQIQFKNIQQSLQGDYNGKIQFVTVSRSYEQYQWFNFNIIDRIFDKSKTSVNYYSDTIFDKASLIAFLKSENKLPDKPRLALEFLKLNNDIANLKKYANYIFDNFKANINSNKDPNFENRIKQGIADLVFEKGGLIYVSSRYAVAEKEKEKVDANNYKILDYKYTNVQTAEPNIMKQEINKYFSKNNAEEGKKLKDLNKNLNEVRSLFTQDKHTGAFAIIQITRDLTGDTSKLLLTAECRKLSKRIKTKFQNIITSIVGGRTKGKKQKKRIKKTRKRQRKIRQTKPYYRI